MIAFPRIRTRILDCMAVALLVPASLAAQLGPAGVERVDSVFAAWHGPSTPGCAVGAALAGATVLQRAYGMAELEHGVPNRPVTVFEAGSVSKQFTTAAAMLLVVEGRLGLDDDVRRHVPELPDLGAPITVRHLVHHTSGLRDWGSVAALSGWGRAVRVHTHDHVLEILSRQRVLNHAPGAEYSYTNSGYNLLAVVIERVAGESFARFSARRIFEPLGLDATRWRDDHRRLVPNRATAYALRDSDFVTDRPNEDVHGNGGLLTTVGDLLRWDAALETGELGGPEFVRLMHEPGVLDDGSVIHYAGGLQVGSRRGLREVSHTGATGGYRAFLARYPEVGLRVAVLCNVGAVSPGQVGGGVVDVFLDELGVAESSRAGEAASTPGGAPREPDAAGSQAFVPPSAADLAAYAGVFRSDEADATFAAVVDDGELVLVRSPGTRFVLEPEQPDAFRGEIGSVRFERAADGAVSGFTVRQPRIHAIRFHRVEDGSTVFVAGGAARGRL